MKMIYDIQLEDLDIIQFFLDIEKGSFRIHLSPCYIYVYVYVCIYILARLLLYSIDVV